MADVMMSIDFILRQYTAKEVHNSNISHENYDVIVVLEEPMMLCKFLVMLTCSDIDQAPH